jgi:hypothetical protein
MSRPRRWPRAQADGRADAPGLGRDERRETGEHAHHDAPVAGGGVHRQGVGGGVSPGPIGVRELPRADEVVGRDAGPTHGGARVRVHTIWVGHAGRCRHGELSVRIPGCVEGLSPPPVRCLGLGAVKGAGHRNRDGASAHGGRHRRERQQAKLRRLHRSHRRSHHHHRASAALRVRRELRGRTGWSSSSRPPPPAL